MTDAFSIFTRLRPRLIGLAYRTLGSLADAEDVVQDVALRLSRAGAILDHEAWLVSATTRASIDRLRMARARRECCVGMTLPEPVAIDALQTPEKAASDRDDLCMGLLAILECLAPEARAAFILREVMDASYTEVSSVLGKSKPACRKMVSRARAELRSHWPPRPSGVDAHSHLITHIAGAIARTDVKSVAALLQHTAALVEDGRGAAADVCRVGRFPEGTAHAFECGV